MTYLLPNWYLCSLFIMMATKIVCWVQLMTKFYSPLLWQVKLICCFLICTGVFDWWIWAALVQRLVFTALQIISCPFLPHHSSFSLPCLHNEEQTNRIWEPRVSEIPVSLPWDPGLTLQIHHGLCLD